VSDCGALKQLTAVKFLEIPAQQAPRETTQFAGDRTRLSVDGNCVRHNARATSASAQSASGSGDSKCWKREHSMQRMLVAAHHPVRRRSPDRSAARSLWRQETPTRPCVRQAIPSLFSALARGVQCGVERFCSPTAHLSQENAMTTLLVEDLPRSDDLDREALLAVRGGIMIGERPPEPGPRPVEPDGGIGGPAGPSIPGLPSIPSMPAIPGWGCWWPGVPADPGFDRARLQ
jgi:hypothetical protein